MSKDNTIVVEDEAKSLIDGIKAEAVNEATQKSQEAIDELKKQTEKEAMENTKSIDSKLSSVADSIDALTKSVQSIVDLNQAKIKEQEEQEKKEKQRQIELSEKKEYASVKSVDTSMFGDDNLKGVLNRIKSRSGFSENIKLDNSEADILTRLKSNTNYKTKSNVHNTFTDALSGLYIRPEIAGVELVEVKQYTDYASYATNRGVVDFSGLVIPTVTTDNVKLNTVKEGDGTADLSSLRFGSVSMEPMTLKSFIRFTKKEFDILTSDRFTAFQLNDLLMYLANEVNIELNKKIAQQIKSDIAKGVIRSYNCINDTELGASNTLKYIDMTNGVKELKTIYRPNNITFVDENAYFSEKHIVASNGQWRNIGIGSRDILNDNEYTSKFITVNKEDTLTRFNDSLYSLETPANNNDQSFSITGDFAKYMNIASASNIEITMLKNNVQESVQNTATLEFSTDIAVQTVNTECMVASKCVAP